MSDSIYPPTPPPLPAWTAPAPLPKKKTSKLLIVILILSLFANLILFFGIIGKKSASTHTVSLRNQHYKEQLISGHSQSQDKIAVIRLQGIISSMSENPAQPEGMVGQIKDQLDIAVKDPTVKAIILRIDSPGGEVLASDQIYRALKEARAKKPVVCYMGSIAASGGFYAAMGTTYIIADELTITGSIGVIMQTLNYKDLFDKVGLKTLTFKSGRYKDILNGDREPTQEEIDLVQSLIMETYDKFYTIVLSERNRNGEIIDAALLRDNLADGRIFTGKQAMQNKLIDQNGYFEDAVKKAEELGHASNAQVVEYEIPFSFSDFFRLFGEAKAEKTLKIDLGLPAELKLQPGKAYFLSYHLF